MAQHMWISRNGVKNSKAMPGADCETDHKPVIARLKIKLQRVMKLNKTIKWNVSRLKYADIRDTFQSRLDKKVEEDGIEDIDEIDAIWNKLRESIEWVADEICGKDQMTKKQNWMTADILRKMEERRTSQIQTDDVHHKRLKHEIQKLRREAKTSTMRINAGKLKC